MKFFLDTANIDEIKNAMAWGIVDGVTTNPTLVAKEDALFEERIVEICRAVRGPVSAEVVSTTYREMVAEGTRLAALNEHVVVKIPMLPDGIRAVKELSERGVKTNVTLVFSAIQALLAAKAGATYVSPFVGRLDEIGQDGAEVLAQIARIYQNYDYATQIIVASVRHPEHVLEAALAGAHVATIPFTVMQKLFKHPLTADGIEQFEQDWQSYRDKQRR